MSNVTGVVVGSGVSFLVGVAYHQTSLNPFLEPLPLPGVHDLQR